ncbi:serine/threonine-protein kinase [Streptomyces sp. SJL17-1]|uniref:serine/threonine-protein kinase n=1 Tax=Streptomyces sp. SJL17-1 TaxID=2967223 RepID=UPI002966B813|nr:serine/threonine-protein kinase [Streptomyces sp. SJL17-1]
MGGPRLEPLQGDDPRRLGAYRLIGRIGSGGMGRVYLGRTVSGRLVAVKTLLAEGVPEESDRRRFAREVALARRVTGAFTVSVMDADAQAPRPWMATEYIPAPSLGELVREAGPLPAPAVRWIAVGMAEALADLHRAGVVHRDVKPGNVLLPLSGPRLIDFGISHALDLTRTTLTLGTMAFTSPEQARGEASTVASDMYSMGATLLHLATSRSPYGPVNDAFRLLARVQRAEVDDLHLPAELRDLVLPLLALSPADRPTPAGLLAGFAKDPTGGRELLPTSWTDAIRAHQDFVAPRPDDAAPDVDSPGEPAAPHAPDAPDVPDSPHEAPTRTAPPRGPAPPPTPASTPTPPSGGGSTPEPARAGVPAGRRRWVRGAVAAAVALLLATGGYMVYRQAQFDGGGGQGVPVAGNCLANVRTGTETFSPSEPRKVDCAGRDARVVVLAAGVERACAVGTSVVERWAAQKLCVSPHVEAGDCLGAEQGDAGFVATGVLWTERACGDGTQLKVVEVVESPRDAFTDCGIEWSARTDSLPYTETVQRDYCLKPA